MANFHGFEITGMKSWTGMEGVGYSGTLHLNGKTLGEFRDDGNGGPIRYYFRTDGLDEAVNEQIPDLAEKVWANVDAEDGLTGILNLTPDFDSVVAYLADMTKTEDNLQRAWRKARSKGCTLVTIQRGDSIYPLETNSELDAVPSRRNALINGIIRKNGIEGATYTVWEDKPSLTEGADSPVTWEPPTKEPERG